MIMNFLLLNLGMIAITYLKARSSQSWIFEIRKTKIWRKLGQFGNVCKEGCFQKYEILDYFNVVIFILSIFFRLDLSMAI